jgi:hypothetical protein
MKKSFLKVSAYLLVGLAVTDGIAKITKEKRDSGMKTFVITETGKFTSLDPLDGDSSQNLPVARMLYATPIEISVDNSLVSRVLESFEYDKATKTIRWVVKSGLTYADGTAITPEDIAFSVSRMAFTRPGFPLVKLIIGLEQWLKASEPLNSYPSGIKINGNEITIALKEDYPHPLFRFCLELFSIIPKSCVNLKTNKIECSKVATSGYYEITEHLDNGILFKKRKDLDLIQGKVYPESIKFVYSDMSVFEDEKFLNNSTVILSSESKLTREHMKTVSSKFEVGFTPAAWFTILQINPDVAPFNNPNCRYEFAKKFRSNFESLSLEKSEGSVFTKLVAGYQTLDSLIDKSKGSRDECASQFRNAKVPWGFDKTTPDTFKDSIIKTAADLGMAIDGPVSFEDRKTEVDSYIAGKSAFMYSRTGFWALDPTGDIQMLFTPNLHNGLRHFWNDKTLQSGLGSIVKEGEVNMDKVNSINEYLFQDGKLNVYSHIRRFYASGNKELVQNLPVGITSRSPWQLFGEQ